MTNALKKKKKNLKRTEHLFCSQDCAKPCGDVKKHIFCPWAIYGLGAKRTNTLGKQRLGRERDGQ